MRRVKIAGQAVECGRGAEDGLEAVTGPGRRVGRGGRGAVVVVRLLVYCMEAGWLAGLAF
jgi:hypothetical protein